MSDMNNPSSYIRNNILASLILGGGGMSSDINQALTNSMYEEAPYKNVLSEEGDEQLVDKTYTVEMSEHKTCPIMHTTFEVGESVTCLPCGHIFDPDGIRTWLKEEKAECPVCRYKLKSKEIKNTTINERITDSQAIAQERETLFSNLSRLHGPSRYINHPFGQSSSNQRLASIVHEDDDAEDIMRAIALTFINRNIHPSISSNVILNDMFIHDSSSDMNNFNNANVDISGNPNNH